MMNRYLLSAFLLIISTQISIAQDEITIRKGLKQIKASEIKKHTTILSSDGFRGRFPGTDGEKLTIDYLVSELKKMEVQPGCSDGSFLQKMDLFSYKVPGRISLEGSSGSVQLTVPENALIISKASSSENHLKAQDLIFIGNGTNLQGINNDLKEKFVLFSPISFESVWPKLDSLGSMGVKGAFLIHDIDRLGLPYEDLRNYIWRDLVFDQVPTGLGYPITTVWITGETAESIFNAANTTFNMDSFETSKQQLGTLALHVDVKFEIESKKFKSHNVVGIIPGKNPRLSKEYIAYTAHWDHLGVDPFSQEDSIFNGASDNAGGVATMLTVMKAFKKAEPDRSLVFVFTTGEEPGMLGSQYFVDQPPVPLKNIIANINIDGFSPMGAMKDVIIIGMGYNSIEDHAQTAAEYQGRYLAEDLWPEAEYYIRGDHYSFAKKGIPALYSASGIDHWEQGKVYGKNLVDEDAQHYHKPSDEIQSSWDWKGTKIEADFFFLVGYFMSKSAERPVWNDACPYPEFQKEWIELQNME